MELDENSIISGLSINAFRDVTKAISEKHSEAIKNPGEIIKLKDHTINKLVEYGIQDLPMMVRKGHLRENILTRAEAKKLGYSTKNKHFHGLGVKNYFEIINSMDNPIAIYQYAGKGQYGKDNFIILTSVIINGNNAIVPVEIYNTGTYNSVDIQYNRIKTTYAKNDKNYINNMLNKGELVEIKKEKPCTV